MNTPTEQQLMDARLRGQDAADRHNVSADKNPYDAAQQRELHEAWEEGRQEGNRLH